MTTRRILALSLLACAAILVMALRPGRRHEGTGPAPAAGAKDAQAEQLARVERTVERLNKDAAHEQEVFRKDGWEIVSATPPDPRLDEYDPSLIADGREQDLRYQLLSTSPGRGHARHIAQAVLLAHDAVTREAAALALGRIRTSEAQNLIMDLLTGDKLDPEDLGRRQLAALLRPVDLDDPIAAKMASLLDSPALTTIEKRQVAFTLGLVSLRDGMELPAEVLASLTPDARDLIAEMTRLGGRTFLANSHAAHAHNE